VWVVGLVVGLIVLFVLLLAMPIDVVFYVERDARFRLGATVRLMFGLIKKDLGSKKRRRREEDDQKAKLKKHRVGVRPLIAALTTRGFAQKLLKLMRDVLRIVKVRELKARVRIGLGDPAETGILFAVVAPTMIFVRSFSSADVLVEPDFEDEKLEGYCQGDIRAVPIKFVRPLVPFVFSRTTWHAVRAMIKARRK
jgi:hypothetical protein